MMLPVLQAEGDAGRGGETADIRQGLHSQGLAEPRQQVAPLRLGLCPQPDAAQPGQPRRQGEQGVRRAGLELQLQLIDLAAPQGADDLSPIPGQFDLGALEGDQPVTAHEVGPELGNQLVLDRVTHLEAGPDLRGEGGQGRQCAAHRGIVFGPGMQSADHLAPAFDGLFRKFIAAADTQSHVESTQIQLGRIEIDIAELDPGR
ncbi:hypothetical protein D3C76_1124230 [compost metagenome]